VRSLMRCLPEGNAARPGQLCWPTGRHAGDSARGFSLVELLVVIAIISLLIAVLIPSLQGAREQAKSVYCRSQLRQMATAAQHYTLRYDGRYPIAYYRVSTERSSTFFVWDFTTVRDFTTSPATTTITPGLLWKGFALDEVQQCPSYEGSDNWLADPYSGYNYNTSYIGHGGLETIPAPTQASRVRTPARTALFGDGQYRAGANKFMRAPWENPADVQFSGRYAGTQGYIHLGKTNVGFCDGHAEAWADRFTETYAHDRRFIAPGTGFLSADNSLYDLE
jgi:prepilin-type N-terminal cleavage/methylation domain-containing protein/prepilin-type processing-associated H-X9-DG protein